MRHSQIILVAACCLFSFQIATADTVQYGDFSGTEVMFLDVTEDTRVIGDTSDFGAPNIVGNQLDFDPLNFASASDINTPSNINDAQLNFTIMAIDGNTIDGVLIEEGGDYTLAGLGNALAQATYGAAIRWDILEIEGVAIGNPIGGDTTFSGLFELPGDTGGPTLWDDSTFIDFNQILANKQIAGGVTKVEFAIDNTLTTAIDQGGSAFIAKKDFGVTVNTNAIPEPTSAALILATGFGLLNRRRR